jgi:hypothetical protein
MIDSFNNDNINISQEMTFLNGKEIFHHSIVSLFRTVNIIWTTKFKISKNIYANNRIIILVNLTEDEKFPEISQLI